jgi:hypothetical protein
VDRQPEREWVDLHNVGSIDATGTIAAPIVAASNVDVI